MCVHVRSCGTALALEHNGDVCSCDHYVKEGYRLGNITDGRPLLELVTSPQQQTFGHAKLDTLPEYCRRCDVRFACNGGCPKDRFIETPDGEPGLQDLCAGHRRFFRHVDEPMRAMAALLAARRDARGIRDMYTELDARRAPDANCTCGSGLLWRVGHPPQPPQLNSPAPLSPRPGRVRAGNDNSRNRRRGRHDIGKQHGSGMDPGKQSEATPFDVDRCPRALEDDMAASNRVAHTICRTHKG